MSKYPANSKSRKEDSLLTPERINEPPSRCTRAKCSPFKKQIVRYNATNPIVPGKSAGRWTSCEHMKFLEALDLFGKDWKKVELYLGTRSGA
jgi:hypothetical protein